MLAHVKPSCTEIPFISFLTTFKLGAISSLTLLNTNISSNLNLIIYNDFSAELIAVFIIAQEID